MIRTHFSIELKQKVSPEVWPWLYLALKHDAIIWESLDRTSLGLRAVDELPSLPGSWTPGNLALFSIQGAAPENHTEVLPLRQHNSGLYNRVVLAHQQWERDEATLLNLEQAGLLALFLREQWLKLTSWNGLRSSLAKKDHNKGTILACLYGLVPEAADLLRQFVSPNAERSDLNLALHALFSNPLPPDRQRDLLQILMSELNLSRGLDFLREVNIHRPWLAPGLAQGFLVRQEREIPVINANDPIDNQCEKIRDVLHFAELYAMAGSPGQTLKSLNGTVRAARQLQGHLSARFAQAAELAAANSPNPTYSQQIRSAVLEAWKHATILVPEAEDYSAGLAKALLETGQFEHAEMMLDNLQNGNKPPTQPALLTIMADLERRRGSEAKSVSFASQALEQIRVGEAINPEDALTLAHLFIELNSPVQAAQAIQSALHHNPAHPQLLALSAMSYLDQDRPMPALDCSYSAIAAGDVNTSRKNWSDQREKLQRLVVQSLEKFGAWEAALDEHTALIKRLESPSPSDWHNLAQSALRAGQPERARHSCKEALDLNPNDEIAFQLMGETDLAQGDLLGAINHFKHSVQIAPHRPDGWLTLARTFHLAGEESQLMQTLRSASMALPDNPEIHLALGEAYLLQDSPTQALASLRRSASLETSPQIALRLGQTLLRLGHLGEAREVLERTLHSSAVEKENEKKEELGGKNSAVREADINFVYARVLRALGEMQKAELILENVVEALPDRFEPRFELARILLGNEKDEMVLSRAVQLLESVVEANPSSDPFEPNLGNIQSEARILLAEGLARIGDFPKSMEYYRQALDDPYTHRSNERARFAIGFGHVALSLNEPESALAVLKEALQAEPRNPSLLRLLGEVYQANGLVDEAFEVAQAAFELTPSDLETLIWFVEQAARLQAMPGSAHLPIHTEVTRALEYATRIAPSRTDLLLRLGKILKENGDHPAALETFRKLAGVIDLETHLAVNDLIYAAKALRELGEAQQAIKVFQRVLSQLNSGASVEELADLDSTAQLYAELSLAQQEVGDLPGALESLDKAIDLDDQKVYLHLQRADLLYEMGHLEATMESLKTALCQDPTHARAQFRVASILRQMGDLTGALTHAEQAVLHADIPGQASLLHTARLFAAELAYLLLRPQLAWAQIHADLAGDEPACDHLSHACLRAEMALDAREINLAAEELEKIQGFVPHDGPYQEARCLVNQARLAVLQHDLTRAYELFKLAMQVLDGLAQTGEGGMSGPELQVRVACLRAVSRAAIELGQWDTALTTSRRLASLASKEPISHLLLAQVLVKRVEAQCLCQDLQVKRNAVGISAISEEMRQTFDGAIESAIQNSSAMAEEGCNLEGQTLDELVPPIVRLWRARGLAVFEPNQSNAFMFGNELNNVSAGPEEISALLMVLRRVGESAGALKAGQNFSRMSSNDTDRITYPTVIVQLALAMEEAEPAEAERIVQEALKERIEDCPAAWPATPMLNYLISRLSSRFRAWGKAQAAIQDALSAWSNEAAWQVQAARIFLIEDLESDLPDIHRAKKHLEEVIHLEPDNAWSYKTLGQIHLSDEDFFQAGKMLEHAVQLSPKDAQSWMWLAQAQVKTGEMEAAAYSAEQAIENDASLCEAMMLRAEIALKANNPRGALTRLQTILEKNEKEPKALCLLAKALEAMDRPEEALMAVEKAIPITEDKWNLYLEKVRLVRRVQGLEAGLRTLQDIIKQHPQRLELVALLSDWLFEAGNYQAAVQVAQAVLQVDRTDLTSEQCSELHYRIGFHMRRAGQLDQAIHHLDQAIENSTGQLEPYLELGRAYQDQRAYNQALKVFQKAITVSPNDYRPYYHAGQALKEGKDFPSAEAMLRKAAQLAPDEVSVHRLLGAVVVLNLVHSRPRIREVEKS